VGNIPSPSNPNPSQDPQLPPHVKLQTGGHIIGQTAQTSITFGPLPHPEVLAGYDQICPGAADRVIKQFEAEGEHRRSMERTGMEASKDAMRRQYAEARWGQVCATLITLSFLGCGAYVALEGQPWAGSILGSLGLGSIVTRMIVGRDKPQKEMDRNEERKPGKARK
jgi:uncharacterized membrane protein